MDHLVRLVHGEHCFRRILAEGQLPVGVILENGEVMFRRERNQTPALFPGECASGRVVEVGDDVCEFDRPGFECLLDRVDIDPVLFKRDRHEFHTELL